MKHFTLVGVEGDYYEKRILNGKITTKRSTLYKSMLWVGELWVPDLLSFRLT